MSKTVFRYDRGELRRPQLTDAGFLRVDGYVARAGVYEYRREDGSIRRELRPPDEVGDHESLASYDDAPLTIGHPRRSDGEAEDVNSSNIRRHNVGNVRGAARFDGELVSAEMTIKDAHAVNRVKAGTQELSPGYRIELDETSGVHPKYGRYDAIQRKIRVNHVAIVDRARGGSALRLRMDDAESVLRSDGTAWLTSIVDGHQHTIDPCPEYGPYDSHRSSNSGCTSWALSEGAQSGHSHDWVRGPDGKITIAMSEGHTHAILDGDSSYTPGFGTQIDRSDSRRDHVGMATNTPPAGSPPPDAAEQIRLLTVRADEADRLLTEQRNRADSAERSAEGLRAELTTTKERIKVLEAQISAGATAVETAAVIEQRTRADAAERELAELRARQPDLVRRRANLVAKATAVLGPSFRCDSLTDREILVAGVRHLRPKEDTGPHVSEDYLARRLDSLIEDRTAYSTSLARASETLSIRRQDTAPQTQQIRADQLPWADQWKAGLGEFSTRKGS